MRFTLFYFAYLISHVKIPHSSNDGSLTVTYAAGGIGPKATTATQYYIPLRNASDDVTFSYEVYFPPDFEFCRGGKLPGLSSHKFVSGGRKWHDRYSVRIMWRNEGRGEAYAYLPFKSPTYLQACTGSCSGSFGDSIGRGSFTFVPGRWNKIALRTSLNTLGLNDGFLEVFHNDILVIQIPRIVYRNWNMLTKYIMFSTFYGGSTKDWAPVNENSATFRNFNVKVKPLDV